MNEFSLEEKNLVDATFKEIVDNLSKVKPTIGCVIPAYNEEESIASVIQSLLIQTRVPDIIHVVVNNTTDNTVKIAAEYAGKHVLNHTGHEQITEVYVHDIGVNADKKVGALNYGYSLIEGYDYFLGVDGDTTADEDAVENLEAEISSDTRIGGISAIYSIDEKSAKGFMGKFLITGQRAQFAAFNMQNLLKGRNMAVLGGQFSIFSMKALSEVMMSSKQNTPWVKDSEVEDSLLSLQIKSAGYLTKISSRARANVGGMTTLRSLDAQQVKWNFGAIELMWPGQRGDTKGQPLHPNLRLRWFENFSMLTNIVTRLLFIGLLIASLSINAFVLSPLWLIPPVVALLINLRTALSIQKRSARDILFALTFLPSEIYLWIRAGHFARAWLKFINNKKVDNWAAQAKAEKGSGQAYLTPLLIGVLAAGLTVLAWIHTPVYYQSEILKLGWPLLGIITILQTIQMLHKALKRHKSFKV